MIEKKNTLQALHLLHEILNIISNSEKPPIFNEIYHQLQVSNVKVSKANLSKYLSNLTDIHFLHRHQDDDTYILGYKMIQYGMSSIDQRNSVIYVETFARDIAKELGETTNIAIFTPNGPLVVRLFTSNRYLNITGPVGTLLPIYSASGKIFAVFEEESKVAEWRAKELQQLREAERELLLKDFQLARENNIAFSKEPLGTSISKARLNVPLPLSA
jgi:IclR family acetate operon transcriptional repressor